MQVGRGYVLQLGGNGNFGTPRPVCLQTKVDFR
jgi:hypothetical protein